MAMDDMDDDEEEEEGELRVVTRRTTRNMHVETGAMILMISSPRESRMVMGFGDSSMGLLGWLGIWDWKMGRCVIFD